MQISKNYFFLILVLFVLFLAGTVILTSVPQKREISPPSLPVKRVPTKPSGSISFHPESLNITSGQEFTVNVFLTTEKEAVNADLEIIYDPKVLIFQKMTLAKFWAEGRLIGQKIDKEKGEILAGVVSFEPASGSGNLISLTFKVQEAAEKAATELAFGEKTQVTSSGGESVPLEVKKTAIYTIIE